MTTTLRPSRASTAASAAPAVPAPTITTSASYALARADGCGPACARDAGEPAEPQAALSSKRRLTQAFSRQNASAMTANETATAATPSGGRVGVSSNEGIVSEQAREPARARSACALSAHESASDRRDRRDSRTGGIFSLFGQHAVKHKSGRA